MSRVEVLADGIMVLSDVVPIDGRVSWVTAASKGYETYNEYLLLSEDSALLIETGVAVHGPSLVATLQQVIGSRHLAVFPTRIELDSVGNLGAILEAFPNAEVGSTNTIEPTTMVHRRDFLTPKAAFTRFKVGETLASFGFPRVRLLDPVIRTLGTSWLWEEANEVLFTADFLCDDMLAHEQQSVIRDCGEALIAPEGLYASILQKFDWLAAADRKELLRAWDGLFDKLSPVALAPVRGRVQFGRALVDDVLAKYRDAIFPSENTQEAPARVRRGPALGEPHGN